MSFRCCEPNLRRRNDECEGGASGMRAACGMPGMAFTAWHDARAAWHVAYSAWHVAYSAWHRGIFGMASRHGSRHRGMVRGIAAWFAASRGVAPRRGRRGRRCRQGSPARRGPHGRRPGPRTRVGALGPSAGPPPRPPGRVVAATRQGCAILGPVHGARAHAAPARKPRFAASRHGSRHRAELLHAAGAAGIGAHKPRFAASRHGSRHRAELLHAAGAAGIGAARGRQVRPHGPPAAATAGSCGCRDAPGPRSYTPTDPPLPTATRRPPPPPPTPAPPRPASRPPSPPRPTRTTTSPATGASRPPSPPSARSGRSGRSVGSVGSGLVAGVYQNNGTATARSCWSAALSVARRRRGPRSPRGATSASRRGARPAPRPDDAADRAEAGDAEVEELGGAAVGDVGLDVAVGDAVLVAQARPAARGHGRRPASAITVESEGPATYSIAR
jgi:hypothetical protein